MTEDFSTPGQTWVRLLFCLAIIVAILGTGVMQVSAMVECYPQRGKWTPWHGTLCYGEAP